MKEKLRLIKQLIVLFFSKKYIRIIISVFFAFYMLIQVIFTNIENVTNDISYYSEYSIEHNIKDYAGVSQEKLEDTYRNLIWYINYGEESLLIDFNQREIMHMRDVHGLYNLGESFNSKWIPIIILFYILVTKKSKVKYENIKYFTYAWFGFLMFFGLVILISSFNFDYAFTKFHEIFFNNDLWILDPKTDLMIRMLPQDYFMNLGIRIAKYSSFSLFFDSIIIIFYYFELKTINRS